MNLFRKPKKSQEVLNLNRHLNFAFSKLDQDINNVQQWVTHLHEKNIHLERSHGSHVDVTKRDITSITRWIHYLNRHNLELQGYLKDLTGHLISLQNKDTELLERIHSLESKLEEYKSELSLGQARTQEGTSKGQVEDKSSSVSLPLSRPDPVISVPLIKETQDKISINKSSLTGSQIELLQVLYESDRPLSYNDLARILNKKGKSVRNLIYELRDKGIDVGSRFVGLRKKGFYLTSENKVKLSGR